MKLSFMRIIKGIGVGLIVVFVSLFAYANTRELTVTEQLPTVQMLQFEIVGIPSAEVAEVVSKRVKTVSGVTACSIDPSKQVSAVMIQPRLTSADKVADALGQGGKYSVKQNDLSQGKACPVAGPMAWFGSLISSLNIRS